MKYNIIRTDLADAQIRKIILYIAENFGNSVALEKLGALEESILEKNLVFYKVNEQKKEIIIYAVVDQRQDYLNILRGL